MVICEISVHQKPGYRVGLELHSKMKEFFLP